ncbi:hypothetical protein ACOME3_005847 [Neoechinorhynchus agilis]
MDKFNIGDRVTVGNKGQGVVAFIGETEFANGQWIGVILNVPLGRNDGSVGGTKYFECEPFHGIFVKSSQSSNISSQRTLKPHSRISKLSVRSLKKTQVSPKTEEEDDDEDRLYPPAVAQNLINDSDASDSTSNDQTKYGGEETTPEEITNVRALRERVAELESVKGGLENKLNEYKESMKGFERLKLQLEQLQKYKEEAKDHLAQLSDKLNQTESQRQRIELEYQTYKNEMSSSEEQIECITVDKEMAEERLEIAEIKNAELERELEEVKLQMEVYKLQEGSGANGELEMSQKYEEQQEKIVRMSDALMQLRNNAIDDRRKMEAFKKKVDGLESDLQATVKINESLSQKVDDLEKTNRDLKEQSDACLGAEKMVAVLTDRNLNLEDKISELNEQFWQEIL